MAVTAGRPGTLMLDSVEVTMYFSDGGCITIGREITTEDNVQLGTRMVEPSRMLTLGQSVTRLKMDIGIDEHSYNKDQST